MHYKSAAFRHPCGLILATIMLAAIGLQTAQAATSAQAKLLHEQVAQQPLLNAAYGTDHYNLLWVGKSSLAQLCRALLELRDDGLDPKPYHVSQLIDWKKSLETKPLSAQDQVKLDVLATRSYLAALQDLRYGKLSPKQVYPDWNLSPRKWTRKDTEQAIAQLRKGAVAQAFDAARPQLPEYAAMRAALRHLRSIGELGGWQPLTAGKRMELGEHAPRVVALRKRLAVAGYLSQAETTSLQFDEALQIAVKKYQRDQGLAVDGVVGQGTRAALNVPVAARIKQLRANLERARWLLPRLGQTYVMVDIAGFRAWYVKDGKQLWASRVQVGKAEKDEDHSWNTPVLASSINRITINPMWTIPPNIMERDILPKLENMEPAAYLERNHLRPYSMATGEELDPDDVDWDDTEDYFLRQDPGPWGALGRMAIRFPNHYLVYLHQTPHTGLFSRAHRAASHGCVRVQKPYKLVELLLGWDREDLNEEIDSDEKQEVEVDEPVPIFLLYFTAWPNSDGHMGFRRDIYQRDADLLAALDGKPLADDDD